MPNSSLGQSVWCRLNHWIVMRQGNRALARLIGRERVAEILHSAEEADKALAEGKTRSMSDVLAEMERKDALERSRFGPGWGLTVARCGRCNGAGRRYLEGEEQCPACEGAGWLDEQGRPSYDNPPDTGAAQ